MTPSATAISKAVSHALRHEPWLYGIELDDEGWAQLDMLVSALRTQGPQWADLDEGSLVRAIESGPKRRHVIDGGRIKALYGHSVAERITYAPGIPPSQLFHGTSPVIAERVLAGEGLRAMARQYVHLSTDVSLAVEVGRRKAPEPTILVVDAGAAHQAGCAFYPCAATIWLADQVPARFLERRRRPVRSPR